MKLSVIITAGGMGRRMKNKHPKQFHLLHNKPVLMHTIQRFYDVDNSMEINASLPKQYIDHWKELCKDYNFKIPHRIVAGGKERYHSIKNALVETNGDVILVHDAVRPLVDAKTILRVIEKTQQKGNAIPVTAVHQSLRKGTMDINTPQNRSDFWMVQTPQGFQRKVLIKAYTNSYSDKITDDASLLDLNNENVYLTSGNEENIKITTPVDLKYAEFLLNRKTE